MSENELPSQNSGCSEQPMDYLNKAADACAAGDLTLGLHLYMAAYEKAIADPSSYSALALAALREAWHLACDLKERSIAEHVFEKLEPYLTGEEISQCAAKLQDLALDRLEEYGFSREDLQEMAEAFSQDYLGADASVVKVEHITLPGASLSGLTLPGVGAPNVTVASLTASSVAPVDDAEAQEAQATQETVEVSADVEGLKDAQRTVADEPPVAVEADAGSLDEAVSAAEASLSDAEKKQPKMGVADVFNPYDLYPESSVGASWHAATNVGSGWSKSVGLDGNTVLDHRFDGFFAEHKEPPAAEGESAQADEAPASSSADSFAHADGQPTAQAKLAGARPAAGAQSDGGASPDAKAAPAEQAQSATAALSTQVAPPGERLSAKAKPSEMPSMPNVAPVKADVFNYAGLVGYDQAVAMMRDYGFGLQHDSGFVSFVEMLNEQHGLTRMPAADTMLFRAPALEDATRFVDATIGELGLPALRMSMEEGAQGMPLLCVTTDNNNRPRMNRQNNRFIGPAILVLEDLDMWRLPEVPEAVEGGMGAFMMANITRGAREAMNMIRAAVEDPDVYVLATSSMDGDVEPAFYEILEPLSIIDIGNPDESERTAIWSEIMQNHPSTRALSLEDLVSYSVGMARYDIYMAAREAIEDAYKQGLVQRTFVPVTGQNMFDKLAACQPLDSDEYRKLEDKVVSEFVNDLDDLEQLLGGAES